MSIIYSGNEETDNRGSWAFTITFEGYWDGSRDEEPTLWRSYTGTLTPERDRSAFQVQNDVREWVRTTHGIVASKIICWDLMENKLPRRGPIE